MINQPIFKLYNEKSRVDNSVAEAVSIKDFVSGLDKKNEKNHVYQTDELNNKFVQIKTTDLGDSKVLMQIINISDSIMYD
jgi:hypothetical protein